jgi:hypothetical protein
VSWDSGGPAAAAAGWIAVRVPGRRRLKELSTAVTVADLLSSSWDAYGEAGAAGVWLPAGFEVTYAGPDGREVRAGLDRLRRADLEDCEPVRSFPSYKGFADVRKWAWRDPVPENPPLQMRDHER